jgi:DNA-binding NarL/FixJ family response regulator
VVRIVVMDDRREVRSALRLVIEQQPDMTVVGEYAHVQELEAGMEQVTPDLVLLDWELDGIPGPRLLDRCRTACPRASVIAMSGRLQSPTAALAAGADAFVGKHDSPEQLLEVLRSVGRAGDRTSGGGRGVRLDGTR